MTKQEAEQFLKDCALRPHEINWSVLGIESACRAVKHDGVAVSAISPLSEDCTCGAAQHNSRVEMAIYKLKGLL